jgi:predicted GNAT family acetyltransferase
MSDLPSDLPIEHVEKAGLGAFLIRVEGKRLGEMVYKRTGPLAVNIEHTEVDDALRGKGAARKMLDALVAWARETKTVVSATCTYAKGQFEKDPSIRDVLTAR